MNRLAPLAVVLSLFAACAPVPAGGLRPLRTTVEVRDDPFVPEIVIVGPVRQMASGEYFLRSWVNRQRGDVDHQIYVAHRYSGDWHFYEMASDQNARALEVVRIDSDVSCGSISCRFFETFGVTVPDSMLRRHRAGYAVKAFAQSGHDLLIELDAELIEQQLAAVDSVRGAIGP